MKDKILQGDVLAVLKTLPEESVDCVITSPPYWGLRDYGEKGQIGLEASPEKYTKKMTQVFREVRRVLKKTGTLWLNLGDSYSHGGNGSRDPERWPKQSRNDHRVEHKKRSSGLKPKDLVGVPWRVAFALQADGWILRQDIIWHKPAVMPESVTDRCTKSHEYVFLFAKSQKYHFEAIKEPAVYGGTEERIARASEEHKTMPSKMVNGIRPRDRRAGKGRIAYGGKRNGEKGTGQESFVSIPEWRNKRSVWQVNVRPFEGAHFATFPEELIEPMMLAGCPKGGVVLDTFMGSGTTAVVAKKNGRHFLGIELNPKYIKMAEARIAGTTPPLF